MYTKVPRNLQEDIFDQSFEIFHFLYFPKDLYFTEVRKVEGLALLSNTQKKEKGAPALAMKPMCLRNWKVLSNTP